MRDRNKVSVVRIKMELYPSRCSSTNQLYGLFEEVISISDMAILHNPRALSPTPEGEEVRE
jgi:hypothetical protein